MICCVAVADRALVRRSIDRRKSRMVAGVIAAHTDTAIKRMIRLLITADRAGPAEGLFRVVLPGVRGLDIAFRAGMLFRRGVPLMLADVVADGANAAAELVTGNHPAAVAALDALFFLRYLNQRMRK